MIMLRLGRQTAAELPPIIVAWVKVSPSEAIRSIAGVLISLHPVACSALKR